jgi:EAL domain-containing protein (putative c-di-GMP-specific phosphodiesterase class I)
LRRLPIDTVKVDQSLIRTIVHDSQQVTFVAAILRLIESVGLRTVVEGIETMAQMVQLQQIGCIYGQGHYFSEPVEADRMTRLLDIQPIRSRG